MVKGARPHRRLAAFLALSLTLAILAPDGFAKGKGPWDEHIDAGRNAMHSGDFGNAESLLKQAMDDTKKFKDDDVRLGTTYFEMGELNVRQGNYTLAKEYYERALNVQQKLLGAESLEAANSLYGIALCNQQMGDHLAAEIFLKRVHEIWRKKLGPKDPKLISILPSMAAYMAMKNDFPTAEGYYKQLVDCAEAGGNQEQVGTYLNLLATTLGNEGKFSEAKDYASRAVEVLKQSTKSTAAIDGAQDNLAVIRAKIGGDSGAQANAAELAAERKREEQERINSEKARNADQSKFAAEREKIAKEQAKAAEQSRIAAEKAKAAEQARIAALKAREAAEQQKIASQQAKEAERAKLAAEAEAKAKAAEEAKIAADHDAKEAASRAKKEQDDLARQKSQLVAEEKKEKTSDNSDGGRKPWQTDRVIKKQSSDSQSQQYGKVRYLAEGKLIGAEEYKAMLLSNESLDALRQEKYRLAVDVLNKALDMCPTLPSAHTNIGLAYNRLGKPEEAIEHLQMAIKLDPSRSAPWVNLATSFQISGRLKDCILTYNEYLTRFPSDPSSSFAKALIKNLQKEADEQDEVEREIASKGGSSNDYFPFTTVKYTVKWPETRIPVKVYIANGSGVQGYKPEFHGIMADAFKSWSNASSDRLKFDFVNNADKADIECVWTTDYSLVGSIAEGGEAQTQYTRSGIEHVKIVILTADPSPESPLTQNQVQAVCLHEIGHSIGLSGHSPKPGDIMFCSMPPAETKVSLSSRDIGTIKHLYQSDVQIAFKEHDKSALASNTTAGAGDKTAYNNEGVDLLSSHAYAQAIEKFETALKLDPNYEVAKENLSSAYNNYALDLINKGKEQEAETFMQKAMKLQSSIRSAAMKLKLTTMHNYALVLRKLHRDSEAAKLEAEATALEKK